MTTTGHTIGLGTGRISSRVLKPPGGDSSNIFGPPDEKPVVVRTNYTESHFRLSDDDKPSAPPLTEAGDQGSSPEEAPAEQEPELTKESEVAEQASAPPSSAAEGGESAPPADADAKPAPKVYTTTRVRMPPGGHSTPLW